MEHKSLLIKNTTRAEREAIIRESMDCGGGSPWEMYQDYIDGKKEIAEINREYTARYVRGC